MQIDRMFFWSKIHVKVVLVVLGAAGCLALATAPLPASATAPLPAPVVDLDNACSGVGGNTASSICKSRGENIKGDFAKSLTNLLLFILGSVAVVMIIIGGIKYASANGDASQITSAKNTIMYSVVGLIVAIMAWSIVSFVINQFS